MQLHRLILHIHTGSHPKFFNFHAPVCHNHKISVNDPDFKAAYVATVIFLLQQARASLNPAQIAAVTAYYPAF